VGKILTFEDAKKILEENPRRLIIREEHGIVEVKFLSPIEAIEPGEVDMAGFTWNPDNPWTKHEAKVEYNGVAHILSLGGERSGLLIQILDQCIKNGFKPDEIAGTVWRIKREGNGYFVEYVGREGETQTKSDDTYEKIKATIQSIKSDMPQYLEKGVSKEEFISGVVIKANMTGYADIKREQVEEVFDRLVQDGVIKLENNLVKA